MLSLQVHISALHLYMADRQRPSTFEAFPYQMKTILLYWNLDDGTAAHKYPPKCNDGIVAHVRPLKFDDETVAHMCPLSLDDIAARNHPLKLDNEMTVAHKHLVQTDRNVAANEDPLSCRRL